MKKIAIIGSGIAGMGCAHLLHKKYDITVFEQNDYVGGHTNTVTINENGKPVFIDTGFMVYNRVTYPHLCNLFAEIKAPIVKTDMSFSVQVQPEGLEYCGSGINGLFAQRKNLFRPSFYKLLKEINRFNKIGPRVLDNPFFESYSLRDYIKALKYSKDFLYKFLIPMSSAVWSTPMDKMLDFPIVTLVRFFKNHGFLGLNTQHQWYTLKNGSQSYRELLIAPFKDRIHCNEKVLEVKKENKGVSLSFVNGDTTRFDAVIFACNANQALEILKSENGAYQKLLSAFKYEKNTVTLHSDESVMPATKRAWSSWNYSIHETNGQKIPTTIYWMNRLQNVSQEKNYFVSVNAIPGSIDPQKIHQTIQYEHPLFDLAAIRAQEQLHLLNQEGPFYFCGSYFKYGFHEDAYKSAVELCNSLVAGRDLNPDQRPKPEKITG